jgi:Mn2+/Fe2+ NRAMP family transporter
MSLFVCHDLSVFCLSGCLFVCDCLCYFSCLSVSNFSTLDCIIGCLSLFVCLSFCVSVKLHSPSILAHV